MTAPDLTTIPAARHARRRPAAPRDRGGRAGARVARRLPRVAAARGAAHDAGVRRDHAALADAFALAVCGGDRRDRGGAGIFRRLVPQRLLSMGLHVARARRRCAVAGAHARLAVSRPRPPRRDRPHGGTRRRVLLRHLAGLCRRADRHGAGPLRGVDQPGAAVAAHAASVAAAARHGGECARDLAAAPHAAGPVAARGVRDLPGLRQRAGNASRRRRSRAR